MGRNKTLKTLVFELWQLFPKGFRRQAVIYTPLSSWLWREGLSHSFLQELDLE